MAENVAGLGQPIAQNEGGKFTGKADKLSDLIGDFHFSPGGTRKLSAVSTAQ
jgi:hypothetical protein